MDNLSVTTLFLLFIFSGAGLTSAVLLTFLLTGVTALNYISIFGLVNLLTYYFYGFLGLIYTCLSSLALIVCGFMYWYEMSFDDIKNQANELKNKTKTNVQIQTSAQLDAQVDVQSKTQSQIDAKLQSLKEKYNEYKTSSVAFIEKKLGLTNYHVQKLHSVYNKISTYYDKFILIACKYFERFKNITSNTPGLKQLYDIYDKALEYKEIVESIRAMHKLSRNMQEMQLNMFAQKANSDTTPGNKANSDVFTDLDKEPLINSGSGAATNNLPIPSISGDLKELENIQKKFNSMPLHEKQKMDEMAMQLFGNMKLNDMVDMMGGLGAISNATPGKKQNKGNKK